MKNSLAELRQAKNLSQEALASQLGISRQTINAIERERFDPSLPLAFKFAAFFDQPIEKIFFPEP